MDLGAVAEFPRRADAQGTRLSHGLRLAIRHRRPEGNGSKIVAKLHDAFKKAIEDPAVIATLAKYDMVPNYKSTEDYKKFVVEITDSERKVIDTLGLAKKTN